MERDRLKVMDETPENEPIARELRAAYPPFDVATRHRLRDQLLSAAGPRQRALRSSASPPRLKRRRGLSGPLIAALVLATCTAGGIAAAGFLSVMPDRHMGQAYTAHTPYTFTEQAVSPGMVTKQEAIAAALHHSPAAPFGRLAPDVTVSARFGAYSDPSFLARSVWLVTFTGSGVNFPINDGGPAPRPTGIVATPPVSHEYMVVIDGKTGVYLEGETFSQP